MSEKSLTVNGNGQTKSPALAKVAEYTAKWAEALELAGLDYRLANKIVNWANNKTDENSARRVDLIRDKGSVLTEFFVFTGKPPGQVTALDILTWRGELENRGLAPNTIYAKISRVSAFYDSAIEAGEVEHNPVDSQSRPKAPKSYQSESTKSLADQDVLALLEVVKKKSDAGDLVAKRDYAILLFLFFSGKRRREIINVRWGDCKFNGTITIQGQVKGGDYIAFEVAHPDAKSALLDYLEAAGRLADMQDDTPLWTSHDRSKLHTGRLTSHAFARNLKRYAKVAGVGDIHVHQTRHTFARWVGEESGSLLEAQDALGHRNLNTTKVYLQRVAVKKDKFSGQIGRRLGL